MKEDTPRMELWQVYQSILDARYGTDQDGIIFRPTKGQGFVEVETALTLEAWHEIVDKIVLVEAGVVEFTAAEKLLFQLFVKHGEYTHG